ncbi:MAG: PQQ-dependent sugar dehydrogenase [Candidatus Sumerlaeia bacterium]|nr:PQQ-dependent sugar dehydrogenase [Candidatus Sumerlaeia bacterium]
MRGSGTFLLLLPLTVAVLLVGLAGGQPTLEPVVTGVTRPVDLLQSPIPGDERLFVVQQNGQIRIVENGTLLATPFLNLGGTVSASGNERGLLGMAFHPNYGSGTDWFFVNYTTTASPGSTVIARYSVSSNPNVADPASGVTLLTYTQPNTNHNGGQIAFGPDGYLYIASGDGGGSNDPNCTGQNILSLLGKILRIDVDTNSGTAPHHAIPATNPFVSVTGRDEIWAWGLRNPWRFSFDRATGDLWIADVGQGAREEINFQPAASTGGENYGWKVMEGTNCTGQTGGCATAGVTLPACNDPSLVLPVRQYTTGSAGNCAIIGGFVYRGTALPDLVGWYIHGDHCSGDIWAYNRTTNQNVELFDAVGAILTFGQARDGELYVGAGTTVYRIAPGPTAVVDGWAVY